MRRVCFIDAATAAPETAGHIRRLTGHLLARMKELEEIGLTAAGNLSEGRVSIRFSGRDNAEAADWLKRKRGIETAYDQVENLIYMQVTGKITFEDIDYVQGAVTELLMQK